MTGQQVTTIVLNWRQKERTLRCLKALERLETPCHTIMVDNGSGDGSVNAISKHFADIELISLPDNIGFAAGCNVAIRKALEQPDCEYVFLVNNDAVLHPKALQKLLASAGRYPEGAILGPKVYYLHDRHKI